MSKASNKYLQQLNAKVRARMEAEGASEADIQIATGDLKPTNRTPRKIRKAGGFMGTRMH